MIVAGVVAVLLALLGAALASALGDDDDGGTDARTGERTGEQSADPQPDPDPDAEGAGDPSQEATEDAGGETQDPDGTATDDGSNDEGSAPDDEDGGPPGTEPETDPDVSLPETPAGYAQISDDRFHFRMSLPRGWERTRIAGQNSGGVYSAADGGPPTVQVDFNSSPGDDAEAAWRELEPSTARNSDDYELIGIEEIEWRGYPTVADWEFERTVDGERVRVLNRGFRVDDEHGYAIMITCPVDEWDGDACATLRETAFETFEPWD
ncbi:hypothetical protein [Streptomyces specialis]|uniref:hypothetical protein n=1 Tax=Streptomyces specialis TaxID=498367 RepID=UPI001F43418B|nr:hypothetical protein [Streptomyces specialis]